MAVVVAMMIDRKAGRSVREFVNKKGGSTAVEGGDGGGGGGGGGGGEREREREREIGKTVSDTVILM